MILIRENADEYVINNTKDVKNFLKQALTHAEREHFAVMFLDNKHSLLKFEIVFSGALTALAFTLASFSKVPWNSMPQQ